ncbi:DUF3224 domain-containing protein [Streptomyces albogriseolus]|uniref:DUF3224 domain-containing protein n=1 Tax=Streptomyces albogriseolus TaxID=1887 RepID=UPI0033B0AEB8
MAYDTAATGTFAGTGLATGRVDGRSGALVPEERGRFDGDGTVHGTCDVVGGPGTGEPAGLRSTGGLTHRHGEGRVPYTFAYEAGRA